MIHQVEWIKLRSFQAVVCLIAGEYAVAAINQIRSDTASKKMEIVLMLDGAQSARRLLRESCLRAVGEKMLDLIHDDILGQPEISWLVALTQPAESLTNWADFALWPWYSRALATLYTNAPV